LITIYPAARILTMDERRPIASHVAVRDGRIVGVGEREALDRLGNAVIDARFAQKVVMPGFVEAHCHITEGTYWRYAYVGYFDRIDPLGRVWRGCESVDAVIARLAELDSTSKGSDGPLSAWGLDTIHYTGSGCTRVDLDRVSKERPIGALHASGHTLSVNSRALQLAGLLRTGIDHPGVPLGDDGLPTGELRGPEPMTLVGSHVGFDRNLLACDEAGLRAFGRLCVRAGVTTATDMASLLASEAVDLMRRVTGEPGFPVRILCARRLQGMPPAALVARALELRGFSTDRMRLGAIKIVVDGSIQGFTARLLPPGYFNGAPNGLWYVTREALTETFELALANDLQVHTHANGDEAIELVLDCFERALDGRTVDDHRCTIQHAQLAGDGQFRRMRALGLCVNLFANHIFHWGEEHRAVTVGPERASRMNACASALDAAVPMAIHTDAPVTPLRPLFGAWCAVNRQSAVGRILGETERIGVAQALRAITLGPAYTLRLDDEIGSIEPGKRADFAILEDDPIQVSAADLRNVRVWGTVQDGRVFPAGAAS